jgi:hypothetical protein
MLYPSWLRRLFAPRRAPISARPRLEPLEDRNLLATLVGVTTGGSLVAFDSSSPGTFIFNQAITGVTSGQHIVAVDFSPVNGDLYGLGIGTGTSAGVGQLYTLNPTTAAATQVGTPFSTKLAGTAFGFSIDPVNGNIRVIDNAGDNLQVSATSGSRLSTDTNITPSSDSVTAMAFSNNSPGAAVTTLYGYEVSGGNDMIVTVGSVGGSPNSPSSGALVNVGPSGVKTSSAGQDLGFAIDANGNAYLNLVVSGSSGLYTANLSTGSVTLVGTFTTPMSDITVAPAVGFTVSGFPASRTQGLASNIIVTAETAYGTTDIGYSGTIHFTSSDPNATLPANTTLVNGSDTVSATLATPGTQSITATDTVNGITGSQTGITVLPNTELVGITTPSSGGTQELVRFNSETPGQITTVATITGLNPGQTLQAIAFRPTTGGMYGLGFGSGTGQLYSIAPTTGVATPVGGPFSTTISGSAFGMSFDPVQDVIRITDNANENFRVDPNTGALIAQDTILTPAKSDVVALAYADNTSGAASTTLYGYDISDDKLVVIGTVGSDTSSDGGVVTPIGASGVTSDSISAAGETGMAIDANGAAYLNLDTTGGVSGLYTVNLNTGLVASNGTFASGFTLADIAVAPATGFAIGNLGATQVAGAPTAVTVSAIDPYGDVAVGYSGTVQFTSSDPAAVLPPNTLLRNGTATVDVTFNTATLSAIPVSHNATVASFNPSTAVWSLSSSNSSQVVPTSTQFAYGGAGWFALTGDFTGDGQNTVVVVDPSTETWYVRNSNSAGGPSYTPFQFGAPGWIPVVGDWNGSGVDGIGVVDPTTDTWYLRDEVSAGLPDAGVFVYGAPGWIPVVGNWAGNANGQDGIGVIDPSTETWYLRDTATAGGVSISPFQFGAPGWTPVAGNWTGGAATGIGVVDGSGTYYLRAEPSAGGPDAGQFQYGSAGSTPVAGTWTSPSTAPSSQSLTATDFFNSNLTTTVGGISVAAPVDLVGLEAGNLLVHFSSESPSNIIPVGNISGLNGGQTMVAIAFRPANDQLYGLGFNASTGTGQLYTINPTTAVATPLPSSFPLLANDTSFGLSFNPVTDVATVISNNGENLSINVNTGALIANNGTLSPSALYSGLAYNNSFLGSSSTTLYSYDFTDNNLVTIGSAGGSPNSPATGQVSSVGNSGVIGITGTAPDFGMSIGGDGVAYLNVVANGLAGGSSGLYTANLSTGVMSFIGTFGTGVTMLGVAEAPATAFVVSSYPASITAGTAGSFTVQAVDPYGQIVPTYRGTVTFTSSDPAATLPPLVTLTNGFGAFSATFNTAGIQTLTASDLNSPTINGSQTNILVTGTSGATSPPPSGGGSSGSTPTSPPPPPVGRLI